MAKINISQFDALYNASAKEVRAGNNDRVKNRNVRAIESALESALDQIDDHEEKIDALTKVVVNGGIVDINKIAGHYREIKRIQESIEDIKDFKKDFFTPVKVTGKGRTRKVEVVPVEEAEETAE